MSTTTSTITKLVRESGVSFGRLVRECGLARQYLREILLGRRPEKWAAKKIRTTIERLQPTIDKERQLTAAVRAAIAASPLTLRKLARESGVSHVLLVRIKRGEQRATPDVAVRVVWALRRIAETVAAGERQIEARLPIQQRRLLGVTRDVSFLAG